MAKILQAPDDLTIYGSGEVRGWHKRVGDVVAAGDLLTELDQDRSRIEVRAPITGTLLEVLTPAGSVVQQGEPLAILGEPTESLPPMIRILRKDGTLTPGSDPGLSVDELLGLYLHLIRARRLDSWLSLRVREGRLTHHRLGAGAEASVLGSAFAMRDDDWIFPGEREFAAALLRGMPLRRYLDHMVGDAGDAAKGRQAPDHFTWRSGRIVSVGSRLDARLTQAVGVALAAKQRRDDVAALVYLGEGLTRTSEFHSAMNFAGVFKAPVVFFGHTELSAKTTASPRSVDSFAHAGLAYGIPGVRVDGNDLFAVIEVTRAAVARAARGEGPTLIEALTRRIGRDALPTNVQDRHDDSLLLSYPLDPLVWLRRYLERAISLHGGDNHDLVQYVERDLLNALDAAEGAPSPAVATAFEDVYQELPWHLVEQRDELLRRPRAPEWREIHRLASPRTAVTEEHIQVHVDIIKRRHFVMSFPLDRVLARFREHHPDFTGDLALHERELKRYFWMCIHYSMFRWPMFGPLDDLWHTFLLFTGDYQRFCMTAAGRYIHHEPARGDEDPQETRLAHARFVDWYSREFGEPPPPEAWPGLPDPPDVGPCADDCGNGSFP